MSEKEESYIDAASRLWNDAKKEYPATTAIASFMPVVSNVTSAIELNDAINRGDKKDMALSAAGMVPAAQLITGGAKAIKAGHMAQAAARKGVTDGAIDAAAYTSARNAGQSQVNKGAAKIMTGATASGSSAASNAIDYADEWNKE